MAGRRQALIVANDEYEHEGLKRLHAPAADAEALGTVLGDPQIGNFAVRVARNEPSYAIQEQIEDILSDGRPDDVLLLHFSCHGLKSESGELFFAASNTRPDRLASTAVSADFVERCMRASRSRSIVLLLDCCYGGAFSQGVKVRASGNVNMLDSFPTGRLGGGRGRAVITASSAMEYAFEGDHLTDDQNGQPSVFTSALVEGLTTGEADRDQDGWVSLNELYDFVFDRVREQNPHQTPSRDLETQGDLYVARCTRPITTPASLPAKLQDAVDNPYSGARFGAVQDLTALLQGRHAGLALAAKTALEQLAQDDSRKVQEAAVAALSAYERAAGQAEAERLQQENAERARLEQERAADEERQRQERAAEQARVVAQRAEDERLRREWAAEQARLEQERTAARRAEEERLRQERAADRARRDQTRAAARRVKQTHRAESLARSRSSTAHGFFAVATTVWALLPMLSLSLLAPFVLLHIALRMRRRALWVAFALSIPLVITGIVLAGEGDDVGNTAMTVVGWVVLLGFAAATTVVTFLLRSAVFARRTAKDVRHRAP